MEWIPWSSSGLKAQLKQEGYRHGVDSLEQQFGALQATRNRGLAWTARVDRKVPGSSQGGSLAHSVRESSASGHTRLGLPEITRGLGSKRFASYTKLCTQSYTAYDSAGS